MNPEADNPTIQAHVQHLTRQLLKTIGEDPDRPGLSDTPARVARMWRDFITYDPGNHDTTFEMIEADQMVIVSPIRVWSMCEHHLLPFWADISIGYVADNRILGLSKFARIAQKHAHRLQVQERLVHDIAADIERVTRSTDIAVLAQGEHLCMSMRGIRAPAIMTSSVMRGVFRDKPEARAEFFSLVRLSSGRTAGIP